jgi:hypothetical protein
MKKPTTVTDRAFTLVVCTTCTTGHYLSVLDELRGVIRRCPHGVLVSAGCLLGSLACASRPDGPGALVVLQPCSIDRAPTGTPIWVGPINDRADVADVRAWVKRGDWGLDALPPHLRAAMNRMRQVGSRN